MSERKFIKDLAQVVGEIPALDFKGEFMSRADEEQLDKARHNAVLEKASASLHYSLFPAFVLNLRRALCIHDEIKCNFVDAKFFDAKFSNPYDAPTEKAIIITSTWRQLVEKSQVNKALFLRLDVSNEEAPWSLYSVNIDSPNIVDNYRYLLLGSKKSFKNSFPEIDNKAALAISAALFNNILGALNPEDKGMILKKLIAEDGFPDRYANITGGVQDDLDQDFFKPEFP